MADDNTKNLTVGDLDEAVKDDDIKAVLNEVGIKNSEMIQTPSNPMQTDTVAVSNPVPEAPVMPAIGSPVPTPVENLPTDVEARARIEAKQAGIPAPVMPVTGSDGIIRDSKTGQIIKPKAQDTNKHDTAGRPLAVTPEVLYKLKQAFLMGCPDSEACLFADISPKTLYNYQHDHPDFIQQKEEWKENPILKARATVYKGLDKDDTAQWFLERKRKKEFSTRQEVVGEDGGPVTVKVEYVVPTDPKPEKPVDPVQPDKQAA